MSAVIELRDGSLRYGTRVLWEHLELAVASGEFLAVLGPNGAGKTTLLKVLLGLAPLSGGQATVLGSAPRRGDHRIGYVPQQKAFDADLPLRGRDLVRFGLDGHRRGVPLANRAILAAVDDAIAAVGATGYADAPIGELSGGEQQRLRIAQALVGDPRILLCDEPLLSLDLAQQQAVSRLIDARSHERDTAVVFVTHDINPIIEHVDRVLYLVEGRWAIGPPGDVMTTEQLTALYRTPVDVVDVRGRIIVISSDDIGGAHDHGHHHLDVGLPSRRATRGPVRR